MDTFHNSGPTPSQTRGLAVDPSGNLFTIGTYRGGLAPSDPTWLVQKSADRGATFQSVDAIAPSDYSFLTPKGIETSPAGTVVSFGTGGGYVAGVQHTFWLVRASTDSGATWNTTHSFVYDPYAYSQTIPTGAAFDSDGSLYVAGSGGDASYHNHWLVNRSADGTTWTTAADDFMLPAGMGATASGIGVSPEHAIFAVGSAYDATYHSHWVVRKSINAAASWTTVEDFFLSGTNAASANAVAFDSTGTEVYVAGGALDASFVNVAVIRRSIDHGATFTTAGTYSYVAGKTTTVNSLRRLSNGHLLMLVQGFDASNAARSVLVESADLGATWTVRDDYFNPDGTGTTPAGMAVDADGNYVLGGGTWSPTWFSSWWTRLVRAP